MTSSQLYDQDFNLWIEQTVRQLQGGDLGGLDREHLIEEIADMGRNNKREVFSRLKVLLIHLLKWRYQPGKRTPSWLNTIDEQRDQLALILADSPSLKPFFQEIFGDCYQKAIRGAVNETGLGKQVFPVECPFTPDQVLDLDFLPDAHQS
jgi:hypothetical protein